MNDRIASFSNVDLNETLADDETLLLYNRDKVLLDWYKFQRYYSFKKYGIFVIVLIIAICLGIVLSNLGNIWVDVMSIFLTIIACSITWKCMGRYEKFKEHILGEYSVYITEFWYSVYGSIWRKWIKTFSSGIEMGYVPKTYLEQVVYNRWLNHVSAYPDNEWFSSHTALSRIGTRLDYSNIGEAQLDLSYFFLHNLIWDLRMNDERRSIKEQFEDFCVTKPLLWRLVR